MYPRKYIPSIHLFTGNWIKVLGVLKSQQSLGEREEHRTAHPSITGHTLAASFAVSSAFLWCHCKPVHWCATDAIVKAHISCLNNCGSKPDWPDSPRQTQGSLESNQEPSLISQNLMCVCVSRFSERHMCLSVKKKRVDPTQQRQQDITCLLQPSLHPVFCSPPL